MAKRIAVTGVSSGIGAELVKILNGRGDCVIGFDRNPPSVEVDQFIEMDLSDPSSVEDGASLVRGGIDGLCNNAGISPQPGREVPILQINFLAQRQFTAAMLPKIDRGAAIVNMASRAGHKWRDNLDQVKRLTALSGPDALPAFVSGEGIDATRAYDLSKEAMILWTVAEAEGLLARDIRVNTLSPGAVATPILEDFATAFGDRMTKNVARAGRAGRPDEIAQIAAFLLSDESYWIKGTDIAIDGGMGSFAMTEMLDLGDMKVLPT